MINVKNVDLSYFRTRSRKEEKEKKYQSTRKIESRWDEISCYGKRPDIHLDIYMYLEAFPFAHSYTQFSIEEFCQNGNYSGKKFVSCTSGRFITCNSMKWNQMSESQLFSWHSVPTLKWQRRWWRQEEKLLEKRKKHPNWANEHHSKIHLCYQERW